MSRHVSYCCQQSKFSNLCCSDCTYIVPEGVFRHNTPELALLNELDVLTKSYTEAKNAISPNDPNLKLINENFPKEMMNSFLDLTANTRGRLNSCEDGGQMEIDLQGPTVDGEAAANAENTAGASTRKYFYFRASVVMEALIALAPLTCPLGFHVPTGPTLLNNLLNEHLKFVLAESISQLGLVISLVGAVSSTALALVFPPLIELVVTYHFS